MLEQNVEFIEEYKRLDKLCKDTLQSDEGISTYIYQMEIIPVSISIRISSWDYAYKLIKHLRWMRNQLVHEKSLYEDFCTPADIKDLQNLYNAILNAKDPLSIALNNRQESCYPKNDENQESPTSFFKNIIAKIKDWFSKI